MSSPSNLRGSPLPRFENRIAVVTGAASGIGRAACERLAKEGATVIALDRVPPDDLTQRSERIAFAALDVSDRNGWHELMHSLDRSHGRIDALVNCAGILREGNIEETDLSLFREVMAVNLDGTFWGCQAALPLLTRSKSAAIVNISSVSGLKGDSGFLAYDASKGAVRLLSKEIALFCARRGYPIRCNSIHPGIVSTRMVTNYVDPDSTARHAGWTQPNGKTILPSEIASMIAWLASDEASFVTGAEFVMDGGMTA